MKKNSKILAILPHSIGGRLTTSSIIDGFVELGFSVDVYDEIYGENFNPQGYDYLLGYDYSAIKLSQGQKTINYFSDVLFDPHSGEGFETLYPRLKDSENISFYWDEELTKLENNPRICYLPHFVNTDIYKNLNLTSTFDVIFMGRLDTEHRLNTFLKILKKFPRTGYFAIEKHYLDAKERLGEDGYLLERAYGGFIDNEKDMALAINKTKIVVNFNEQGIGSLNYRTFQTMACEKILLSDYRSEGVRLFGDNFIQYTDDLIQKIDFYLENEPTEKLKKLRKIVEENFSHRAGVGKMVDFINKSEF